LRVRNTKQSRAAAGNGPRLTDSRKHPILRSVWKHRAYYCVLFPVLLFFFIFSYTPMYGIIIAFKDYKIKPGIIGSPWADPWYKHFQMAFSSETFRRAMWNTLAISFLKLIVAFPFPIAFALLLDELPGKGGFKKSLQTVSYLPHFISWVILSGILRNLLSPSFGALNAVIEFFGGEPQHFFGDPEQFRGLLFWSHIWQSTGYGSIVYLAAISGIDQEQLEAAKIDGASRMQIIRHITIPSILPVICIMMILNLGSVLSAGFDQVFNMYSPIVYSTGDIIDTYVYRYGLVDFKYSFSTAVNLFKNVIGLILVVGSNLIVRRLDPDSALF